VWTISEKCPFHAASADGVVRADGLVEAKRIHPREK